MVTNQPTDGVILNLFINTVDDFFIFLPLGAAAVLTWIICFDYMLN